MKQLRCIFIIQLFLSICLGQASAAGILTWQDCILEASKNNPDLISAQEAVKESEAGKKITASNLFPQIEASAQASTSKTGGATVDSYSYGASASQLLFDGLKTANNIMAAGQNLAAARYNYKFRSSEVRYRLRSAFINLLKMQELLKITEDIYNIRRSNLELIALRYQSGIEHKGALLSAEANLAQAEFEIAQAKRALEAAQRELTKEMGRAEFSPLQVAGDFNLNIMAEDKPDFEALAKENPSLGRSIAQKNAASYGIKSAQANFFPQISAQAGASRSSTDWPPEDDRWNAGLSLSVPIFEGGLRLAQVAQAQALFNQARENERSTKDSIILELQQSWAAFQDAIEAAEVERKFLASAEERAKISESQYSLGLIQFDNWTIIEDELVRAKKALLNAQTNALLAEANWVSAKGETLEYAN